MWANSQPTFRTLPYHGNRCFHLVVDAGLHVLTPRGSVHSLTVYSWSRTCFVVCYKISNACSNSLHLLSGVSGASPIFPRQKSSFRTCSRELLCVRLKNTTATIKYVLCSVEQLKLTKYKHLNYEQVLLYKIRAIFPAFEMHIAVSVLAETISALFQTKLIIITEHDRQRWISF